MAILVQSNKKPSVSFPSQTGSIVTFNSQYAGLPLKSCVVDFEDETGINSLNFSATGKNLWGGKAMLYSFIKANIRNATVDEVNNTIEFSAYLVSELSIMAMRQFKQNTQYTLLLTIEKSNNSQSPNLKILYSDGTEDYFFLPTKQAGLKQFFAIKTNPNKTFVGFIGNNQSERTKIYCDECCVLEGDKTTDDFIPFGDNKLFSFGKTIQNGSLNVLTGELTNNDMTPPEVINLGGMEISALQGENNLFASTGDTTVQHIKIGG